MIQFLHEFNNILYAYVLIVILIGCGLYFTIRTKCVQLRLFGESCRLLIKSNDGEAEGKHISNFQAFALAVASRVGVGNIAGVAIAMTIGGPGSIFWMWVAAILGSATGFVEATLAQLYKKKDKDSFIGGPSYYMADGLGKRWMGIVSAIMIILTFTFGFDSVQCNTLGLAFEQQFGLNHVLVGLVVTALVALVIYGGIQRVAKVASVIAPVMAIGYVLIAIVVICMNLPKVPDVFRLIFESAFSMKTAAGGIAGAVVVQGVRRGLFSNEAGLGSIPNAAATAHVSHPVKQGLVQSMGVVVDTLIICSSTAFIILFSGVDLTSGVSGIELAQEALNSQLGPVGSIFITIALAFFVFSTLITFYYYGEANLKFCTKKKWTVPVFKILVLGGLMAGFCASLDLVWEFTDTLMAFCGLFNLLALVILGPKVFSLTENYVSQKRAGIKDPVLKKWWEDKTDLES